jgi:hypothetical protein
MKALTSAWVGSFVKAAFIGNDLVKGVMAPLWQLWIVSRVSWSRISLCLVQTLSFQTVASTDSERRSSVLP